MQNQIPLIDDPARLEIEARQKGQIAADRGLPRECEFTADNLRSAWFAGYDQQLPHSWVLHPKDRFWIRP